MFELSSETLRLAVIISLIEFGASIFIGFSFFLFGARHRNRSYSFWHVIVTISIAPFLEEFVFRWPTYWLADGSFSPWVWVLLVIWGGIIFGFLHLFNIDEDDVDINAGGAVSIIVSTMFFGLLQGWLVVTTDSILPSIIAHCLYNLYCFIWRIIKELIMG